MIPIADPEIDQAEQERVQEVLESGMIADGPEVREFEAEFAEFCGADHAIGTSNGTTALHAALQALGLGEGDTVVTTPFSFVATANVIRLVGAEPVFADIDPETYNLDPEATASVAREHDADAIMPVHLYGLPSEMDELVAIADELDAYLIEDAAQAHGATYNGDPVGSIGDVACFSFYPTKNMTTGEGGMVTTNDPELDERVRQFINHGRGGGGSYAHETVGHNFRMTSIAAALGRGQLGRLPDFIEARRSNARRLTEGLADAPVVTPTEPTDRRHVYHQYTVRVQDRDRFTDYLDEREIGYGVYYPTCIHNQPAYTQLDSTAPAAETAANEVVSLPVHPNLSDADVETIISEVTAYDKLTAN